MCTNIVWHKTLQIVTRFAKRGLIHAQFRDTLFVTILIATSMYHVCKLPQIEQAALLRPISQAYLMFMSDQMAFKWPHLLLVSRQPTVIYHTTD